MNTPKITSATFEMEADIAGCGKASIFYDGGTLTVTLPGVRPDEAQRVATAVLDAATKAMGVWGQDSGGGTPPPWRTTPFR